MSDIKGPKSPTTSRFCASRTAPRVSTISNSLESITMQALAGSKALPEGLASIPHRARRMLTVESEREQVPHDFDQSSWRARALVEIKCQSYDGLLSRRAHDRPEVEARGIEWIHPCANWPAICQ